MKLLLKVALDGMPSPGSGDEVKAVKLPVEIRRTTSRDSTHCRSCRARPVVLRFNVVLMCVTGPAMTVVTVTLRALDRVCERALVGLLGA